MSPIPQWRELEVFDGDVTSEQLIKYTIQTVAVIVPLILVGIPIGFFIWASVWSTTPGQGGYFTLAGYVELLNQPGVIDMFKNTIVVMLVGSILSLLFGVSMVVFTNKFDIPGTNVISFLLIVQYILPSLLLSMGWALLGSESGLINRAIMVLGLADHPVVSVTNEWGIALVLGLHYSGLVYLLVHGAISSVPRSMEESARISGASPLMAVRRVTLSLSFPSLLIAAILVMAEHAQNFAAPLILGLPSQTYTISTYIFIKVSQFPTNFAVASAAGLILIVAVVLALVAQWYIEGQSDAYQTVVGRGGSETQATFSLERRSQIAVSAFLAIVIAFVVAPLLYLFASSFLERAVGFFSPNTELTLRNYYSVLLGTYSSTFWDALVTTIFMATVGSFFTMVLSSIISYTIVKGKTALSEFLDILVLAPIAIPLVVIGVSYLWFFLSYNILGLYGTIWLIIIAIASREIVYGTRAVNSSMHSIGDSLEEVAQLSGANLLTILRRIYYPLIKPGFFAGFLIAFIHYFKAFTRPVLLRSPDLHVLSTLMEATYSQGDITVAVTVATLMAAFIISITAIVEFFTDISLTQLS